MAENYTYSFPTNDFSAVLNALKKVNFKMKGPFKKDNDELIYENIEYKKKKFTLNRESEYSPVILSSNEMLDEKMTEEVTKKVKEALTKKPLKRALETKESRRIGRKIAKGAAKGAGKGLWWSIKKLFGLARWTGKTIQKDIERSQRDKKK